MDILDILLLVFAAAFVIFWVCNVFVAFDTDSKEFPNKYNVYVYISNYLPIRQDIRDWKYGDKLYLGGNYKNQVEYLMCDPEQKTILVGYRKLLEYREEAWHCKDTEKLIPLKKVRYNISLKERKEAEKEREKRSFEEQQVKEFKKDYEEYNKQLRKLRNKYLND